MRPKHSLKAGQVRPAESVSLSSDMLRGTIARPVNPLDNSLFPHRNKARAKGPAQLYRAFCNDGTAFQEKTSSSNPSFVLSSLRSSQSLPQGSECSPPRPQNIGAGRADIHRLHASPVVVTPSQFVIIFNEKNGNRDDNVRASFHQPF